LDTSEKEYEVSCVSECVVVEQTANFAGFRTWANGQRVELVDDKEIQGRIAYHLGAGDYVIKTKFTQLTPSRMVGNGITLVAVGVLIYKLVSQVASFSRLTKRVK
jgi:hypothetical protein